VTFTITVNAVNDQPSISFGGNQVVNEDAGAQTVGSFATGFAPGGGSDEAGQTIDGFVVSNDNNALFSAQPAIDSSGQLTYTPADDVCRTTRSSQCSSRIALISDEINQTNGLKKKSASIRC